MIFNSSPNQTTELYTNHLQQISGSQFTFREVDVIACIMHNRTDKKIAQFLGVAPKTVASHLRNILGKLGCHSRDNIIDFIEKSGKLQYLRQYYFNLVIKSSFNKSLEKIRALINRTNVSCSIIFNKVTEKEELLISQLEQSLALANITLIRNITKKAIQHNKILHYLYVSSEKSLVHIDNAPFSNTANIILFFDKDTDLPELSKLNYIDFSVETNYYFSVCLLIEKIIDQPKLKEITLGFKNEYQALQESWQGDNIKKTAKSSLRTFSLFNNKVIILTIAIFIAIIISIVVAYQDNVDIHKINSDFANFVKTITSDNITKKDSRQQNYNALIKVKNTISSLDNPQVQKYFTSQELELNELMNCLYVLQTLSNQYTYIDNDGQKALKLLQYAKSFAEQYILNKSTAPISFNKLTKEELYIELGMIADLPELYAKVMYVLGRAYICNDDLQNSVKYFELSKYLGYRLNLFEGYLSFRSGLEIARREVIMNDISGGNFQQAKTDIKQIISLIIELREDSREYKINYKAHNITPEIIVPSQDVYNRILCNEQLVNYYLKLITITDNTTEQAEYIKEISTLFTNDELTPSILTLVKKVADKKAASIYNSLAFILLTLHENNIDFREFKETLIRLLDFKTKKELELIEHIFFLSKSRSKNTDYSKPDAYDGLIRVYKQMQKQENTSINIQNELQSHIEDLQVERDNITTNVRQANWKLRQYDINHTKLRGK